MACLLKPRTSRRQSKQAEISRNDRKKKRSETTQNDANFKNWGNLEFSTSFGFSNFEPKCPNLGILGKEVSTFESFNKILPVPYFEGADFKSDICFQKFLAQIPKFKNFGPKAITFLILMKFCLYAISKVLISNLTLVFEKFEPKSPNIGILGQNV